MKTWKFWKPESGFIGVLITGFVIFIIVLFMMPLIGMVLKLWYNYLGA